MGDLQSVIRDRSNDKDEPAMQASCLSKETETNAKEKAIYRQKVAYEILTKIREIYRHKRGRMLRMRKLFKDFGLMWEI